MKKRVLALVCCLSLTLGLFTYRPPEAKAIVTEASLATSVLWSFMQSAGITFNGTGMNSSSWAEAIEPYLRDFTEWKDSAAQSFWHWLGYDGASEFIKALSWSKITHPTTMPFPSVVIPPAAAKKMGEFTHWFAEKVGLVSGGESKPVVSISGGTRLKLSNGQSIVLGSCVNPDSSGPKFYEPGTVLFTVVQDMYDNYDKYSWLYTFSNGYSLKLFFVEVGKVVINADLRDSKGNLVGRNNDSSTFTSNLFNWGEMYYDAVGLAVADDGNTITPITRVCKKDDQYKGKWVQTWHRGDYWCKGLTLNDLESFKTSDATGFASQPGALSPTYDDKGEKPTVVAYPNINGDLTSINDLLQQILDKLAANDLNSSASLEGEAAPDVPATDIGWKGTIEKIYQGIIDLPGRIADAFKALLEGLFAPDAALMQEMTDTFKNKFSFLTTLHKVGTDLFGMTAETDPPVIWVHLEDAEGKYTYGGPVKALDLSWYQRYKADVDKLISGFLWLAFLWLLFKRAASIIHGGEMYTEYASDIRDYYRSGKKDDGPTVPVNRRLGE